jgi:O-antigen/teichoic acid export membrane protein
MRARIWFISEVTVPDLRMKRLSFLGVLTDQAVVSAGNFGLNILLARSFSEADYGAFAFLLSFILFLNSLHQAFVTFPLSVQGASAPPQQLNYLLALAVSLTLLEAMLFLPVIGGASLSAHRPMLFLPVFLFMLAWQLQEVWRRALIARARHLGALASDSLRYVAALAVVAPIAWFRLLSLPLVFLLLIIASLIAAWPLLPRLLAEHESVRRNLGRELRAHWQLASPVLSANLLAAFSTQWFLWLLAWGHGLASSAVLVALANILGFSSPVMFGLENILVPEIARQKDSLSFRGLIELVARRALAGGALVAPFFVIVMIWPAQLLHLFYGAHKSYGQFTLALQLLAAAYVTYLIAYVLSATLRGYRATGAVLKMQLYPALLGATLGTWLTLSFGVTGACSAALAAGSLRVAIGWYHVGRLRALTAPEPRAPAPNRLPDVPQSV